MMDILGVSAPALFGQLLVGLINGSFYALLSLGLAIIFGLLHVVNFTHGAQYMLGAFFAWVLLAVFGIGYWPALIIAPIIVAAIGVVMEKLLVRHVYKLDHFYGLLLTLGISLVIEGLLRNRYGMAGLPYPMPESLTGAINLGFMYLPIYRAWVVVFSVIVCFGTWYAIERTRLGSYLRAAEENATLVQAFGINVPRLVTLTYALGVGLAAIAGVLAAPMYQVSPTMGSSVIITVFAVVVIGGMGSLLGAIIGGFAIGIIEGLTKLFYPEASTTIVFIIMAILLLVRPTGLFGGAVNTVPRSDAGKIPVSSRVPGGMVTVAILVAVGVLAPFFIYPIFAMKVLCYALFACAFGLLAGFGGLVSFGHAAFFGSACYITAYMAARMGLPTEISIVGGTLVAGLLGVAFGWLAIRRQGIYFAMITMALSQLIYFAALQAPFTGGEDGLQGVPRGLLFGFIDLRNNVTMYYFVFAVFVAAVFAIYRIVHSPFGQVLRSLRENETRAVSLGYDADRVKLLAFVLSATLSGLAGALKVLVVQIATLSDVHWALSGEVLLMGLIGGIGNVIGPIVGAAVVILMQTELAGYGAWVTIIQGMTFVFCVLVFRRGIVGMLDGFLNRLNGRAAPVAVSAPQH